VSDLAARWRVKASRIGFIDRHLRAIDRANGLRFTRWAAGIALFGYLALFPLLVLAFVVFGIALASVPELRVEVETFLKDGFPLIFAPEGGRPPVDIEKVAEATVSAGVISVVGLLVAGLGWVDSSMEGVRRMQGAMRRPRGWLLLRLQDTASLLVVGSILLIALVGSVALEAFGTSALRWAGIEDSSSWWVQLSAALILGVLVWLVVVAFYGFAWWNRRHRKWRVVLLGALYTTTVIVVLTQVSFVVVGRTLGNPVYGALAVAAALLLFLYIAAAALLYFASWVAVCEGAPPTREEVAYLDRLRGGDITLPTARADGPPSAER
jgi:membrane protein